LSEYAKAPEITRKRLYIETMEEVLGKANKVVIDQKEGGNNIMYLPLDQIMKSANRPLVDQSAIGQSVSETLSTQIPQRKLGTRGGR